MATRPDRSVAGWRFWYDGDRLFTQRDSAAAWLALPDIGAQLLKVYYANGNSMTLLGNTFYFRAPAILPSTEIIFGAGSPRFEGGTRAEIVANYPGVIIKMGRWESEADFDAVKLVSERPEFRAAP